MGRPPCCDKLGVKKGPWTPEEDIILVSYIQEHGPGNWRSVPTNSGLLRCSKSCRLRWTNYLRPGIKRGNFTAQEEKLIFHLQALLGNRWAAIASYLPERTDNDIKNYWNTHLKKKLRKLDSEPEDSIAGFSNHQPIAKGQWEKRLQTDINMAKQALQEALSMDRPSFLYEAKPTLATHCSGSQPSSSFTYASSTENISRLLENWVRKSPKSAETARRSAESSSSVGMAASGTNNSSSNMVSPETSWFQGESKPCLDTQMPLSQLETWLFEESFVVGGHESSGIDLDMALDASVLLC